MFVGRTNEMTILQDMKSQQKPKLVVISGRRRIGKSRLVQEFAKKFDHFLEFQGLAPTKGIDQNDQLQNLYDQFIIQSHSKEKLFTNWTDAFFKINNYISKISIKKSILLFFDEISWIAYGDKAFAGKLKIAWDTLFKKNNNIFIILCGSVSSWIENNILKNKDFVGRINAQIQIEELGIKECAMFWEKQRSLIASEEIIKMLSVIGGVPRYLEEVDSKLTSEENIKRLCFTKEGMLFHEFDKIFNEIFDTKSKLYIEVLKTISESNLSGSEISKRLKQSANGPLFECLRNLETAGFIKRDYAWKLKEKTISKLSHYRLKDNYIRFYLKYILPIKSQIANGTKSINSISQLSNWPAISGYQFENLVLNNLNEIIKISNINPNDIINIGPYFQNTTQIQKGVQIDLLIQDRFNSLYLFEVKCKRKIGIELIKEVQQKIKVLKRPKGYSIRTGLIYLGEISEELEFNDFFSYKIDFASLLTG